jgi:hypothetical protein
MPAPPAGADAVFRARLLTFHHPDEDIDERPYALTYIPVSAS